MGVRFLHAADLHLGSPLRAVADASAELAEELGRASYVACERITTEAIERDVDFVVLAGDVYDREARSIRANQFVVDQCWRLHDASIPCYVVHGNHDPLGDGAEKLDWPPTVRVFASDDVEAVHFPAEDDPRALILGQSYGRRHESNRLYYHYTPEDRSVPAVGVLHTDLDPDGTRYAPCSAGDLASKDVDYWALGHVHGAGRVAGAPAAYPGIPQGRHVGETGVGGCLLVDLEVGNEPDLTFVPVSPIVWQEVPVDLTAAPERDGREVRNVTDVAAYVDDLAVDLRDADRRRLFEDVGFPVDDDGWEPDGFVCRWVLEGRCGVHDQLGEEELTHLTERLRDRLRGGNPFVWTEAVRDRTAAALPDVEELATDDDVVDEFLRLVEDCKTDPETREKLRAAAGAVWEPVADRDREDVPPTRLPLDEERLDELIDRARAMAVDELVARRHDVD